MEETENLQTAVLLTGVNQTDHLKQFKTLSQQITNNCSSRVTILQSRDCTTLKSAVEMLVSGFISQQDEGDEYGFKKRQLTLPVLEAWYRHRYGTSETKPLLVVMIGDFEQFNATCVQELISILCCYTNRLPFVLIAGVATAFKALHNVLPSHITNKMNVNIFESESSMVMLNRILEEVVLTHRSPFQLSGKSFQILMDVFTFYDFSLHSFIKGYKIFMLEHYRRRPFNLTNRDSRDIETEILEFDDNECEDIRRSCPSFRELVNREVNPQSRIDLIKNNDTLKFRIITEVNKMTNFLFSFHCSLRMLAALFDDLPKNELGHFVRQLYPICISTDVTAIDEYEKCFSLLRFTSKEKFLKKLEAILEILRGYTRDGNVSSPQRNALMKDFGILEVHCALIAESGMSPSKAARPSQASSEINTKGLSGRQAMMEQLKNSAKQNHTRQLAEYEQRLYDCLDFIEDFMKKNLRGIKSAPAFNELFIFDDYRSVRDQIIGAPRGVLHNALINSHRELQCTCCSGMENDQIVPTAPDLSIGYRLLLENNKSVNLFDWLQSFASVCSENIEDFEITPEIQ